LQVSAEVDTDPGARARQRVARAEELAAATPAAAELLTFSARLIAEQRRLYAAHTSRDVPPRHGDTLAEAVDRAAGGAAVRVLLRWRPSAAPDALARAASDLGLLAAGEWRARLDAFVDRRGAAVDESCEGFVLDASLQPFAEACALRAASADRRATEPAAAHCPFCGDRPALAVLREAGHGARRSLLCGLCQTEWPALRIGCAGCGEARFDQLPVFSADAFDAARIDACESCHGYLKTIDFTRNGRAVPIVDDLATLALDLWAREQGYRRLRPHLLRV
jgi:FdhE protein